MRQFFLPFFRKRVVKMHPHIFRLRFRIHIVFSQRHINAILILVIKISHPRFVGKQRGMEITRKIVNRLDVHARVSSARNFKFSIFITCLKYQVPAMLPFEHRCRQERHRRRRNISYGIVPLLVLQHHQCKLLSITY